MYRTVVEAVLEHGKNRPDKCAVSYKEERLTYGELSRLAVTAGTLLAETYGVRAGDRVMLSAVTKPAYVVLYLGIQYLGAVSVPMEKNGTEKSISEIRERIAPKVFLTDLPLREDFPEKVSLTGFYEEIKKEAARGLDAGRFPYTPPSMELPAEILFTTGTTGVPKGVVLTGRSVLSITRHNRDGVGMQEKDILLLPLPLNHSVGMREIRTTLYVGGSLVLLGGFAFPKAFSDAMREFSCTAFVCVPASLELLLRQMGEEFVRTFKTLRYMEVGAGSLSVDTKKKLLRLLPDTVIYNTWGSTETGGAIFLNVNENQDRLISLGKPVKGVTVKTVDRDGKEVKAENIETAGRMALCGEMCMAGYFEMPEETEKALSGGWLITNDLVYSDGDGFWYMVGRSDDIINVGGKKVSPIEVENVASQFPEIRECACIGVKDPEGILGSVPALYMVPEGEKIDEGKLVRFLSTRMEPYKLPKVFLTIDELPRNRMKKLDRKALYRRYEENGCEPTENEVIRCILSRRSVRAFTERELSKPILETLVRAGIRAPSGHNLQTWRFTVLQRGEKLEALWEKVRKVCEEKGIGFFPPKDPAAVVLVSGDRRNETGGMDCACAAENIMLAAHSLGIGSVWVGALRTICDEGEIREALDALDLPKRHLVYATVCLGYPAENPPAGARRTDVVRFVD